MRTRKTAIGAALAALAVLCAVFAQARAPHRHGSSKANPWKEAK